MPTQFRQLFQILLNFHRSRFFIMVAKISNFKIELYSQWICQLIYMNPHSLFAS